LLADDQRVGKVTVRHYHNVLTMIEFYSQDGLLFLKCGTRLFADQKTTHTLDENERLLGVVSKVE
jgi:uncharacterized protein YjhX (UPF0386 family)